MASQRDLPHLAEDGDPEIDIETGPNAESGGDSENTEEADSADEEPISASVRTPLRHREHPHRADTPDQQQPVLPSSYRYRPLAVVRKRGRPPYAEYCILWESWVQKGRHHVDALIDIYDR
ncbi:hypothetical protein PISL3812_09896 [Talaromyces islandicus]|uniref:Uncharacterized protein n=1 Tax=Talaromyces islandicus TaxID=28573 RepID=A0A0U1MB93_TALIS|nr:hypothetical protein PISL3812_09896 [Talaromyces islandicus]